MVCLLALGVINAADAMPSDLPYVSLRQAYASQDAAVAAGAYAIDATYVEVYAGAEPRVLAGRKAIEAHFGALFTQIGGDAVIADLNFRRLSSASDAAGVSETGLYRLRVTDRATGATQYFFGFFATRIARGVFTVDVSREATEAQFEAAPGALMFDDADERLSAGFHDALTGVYRDERGCDLLITRSEWRLFALNECTWEWRALNRRSGFEWWHGDFVLASSPLADQRRATVVKFTTDAASGRVLGLQLQTQAGGPRTLVRQQVFRVESSDWSGSAGRLEGTLYRPVPAPALAPAYVLLHGSGPQDRHGYASYIALMAAQLARSGSVVLAFDKRGTGGSSGSTAHAGFDALAEDATAAMRWLAQQPGVDPKRIGIAGSSQAGWVAASMVKSGAAPFRVLMLGAAGAAMSVEEQNIHQTARQLRCEGLPQSHVDALIRQQRAFFSLRDDRMRRAEFVQATEQAQALARDRPELSQWIFPDPTTAAGAAAPAPPWYETLDTGFDPRPVWERYAGRIYAAFGGRDESTPAALALRRLRSMPRPGVEARRFAGAQHLGLLAKDDCATGLGETSRFHPLWWPAFVAAASSP